MKKRKHNPAALLCNAAGTVILIILILACLPLTLPRLAGYSLYSVISGSMEPEIPVGSLVLIHDADPVYVEEGDVIAFYEINSIRECRPGAYGILEPASYKAPADEKGLTLEGHDDDRGSPHCLPLVPGTLPAYDALVL